MTQLPPRSTLPDTLFTYTTLFRSLGERRNQLAGTLSGGEKQMLALACGLGIDPSVLLVDELSMGLAPLVVGELYERSEEHTSELQSLMRISYAVFCLKKKKIR